MTAVAAPAVSRGTDVSAAMNVALVSTHYGPPWNEGVRNLARRLVEFLENKGATVQVITPRTVMPARLTRLLSRVPLIGSLLFGLLAARAAARAKADVVFAFVSVSPVLGVRSLLLRRATRRPLVLYVTGVRRLVGGYSLLLRADRVFVISEYLRRYLPGAATLPPFIDPARVRPSTQEPRATSPREILFLGAFEKARGVEYLVDAMRHLSPTVGARLVLAWNGVGSDASIRRAVRRAGVEDRVHFVGSADVAALYARASVVVIPRATPERMAFPVRIVEAVTAAVPLVVTTVNGMDRLIDGCGLAVEPRNTRALAAAIERLLTDDDYYRRCVERCRQTARELNSERHLEALYRQLRQWR